MSDQPAFRIQTVADMTGVNPVTLRAWERRYGVPRPVRTSGSYRLYSNADVEQVRRMCALCESGMSASQAAKAVRDALDESPRTDSRAIDATGGVESGFVEAIRRMDIAELERQMAQALTRGSATQIFERIVAPVMVEVGALWERGAVSIAHEHLAAEFFTTHLGSMLRLVQPVSSDRIALLACFPDELHSLPLYGVAFRLAEWGCRSQMLGPRTPPVALAGAVKAVKPALVALSVTVPASGAAARETVEGYALACAEVPWIVGGAGAQSLAELVESEGGTVVPQVPNALHSVFERALSSRGNRRSRTKR